MADKKISEATPDAEMTGTEKIPLDDGGVAKFATTEQFKNFVLAKAASIERAGSVAVGTDGVYILKDGVLKPVDASTLATAVLDYGFGKAGVAAINGNEIVCVKDVNDLKTITVTALKAWLERNLSISAELDISSKPSATLPLENGNYLVIEQGSGSNRGNRRLTVANFADWVHNRFIAYVGQLTRVENLSGTDQLFIVRTAENTSLARVCTVSQLTDFLGAGDVTGPETTTENKIPQWDSAQKKLKDGLTVVGTITDETASGSNIPTAGAVKSALDQIDNGTVKTNGAQNIQGVKTFLASPVVPTPTQDMQAATKKYVDETIPGNVVDLTNNQSVGGVKTFIAPPVVPAPAADMNPATKKYVDDNCVKLTGAQTVNGVKTFGSSPVIPTVADSDNSTKAASTAWVVAKLASWWNTVKGAAHSISGLWTFTTSPVVPIPTQDTQAANKKYVDEKAVALAGDQTVAGTKTFTAYPLVPTVGDVTDDTQKAASTAFVKAAIAAIDHRLKFVSKTFDEQGNLTLDDLSLNAFTLPVIPAGDEETSYTVSLPAESETNSRYFGIVLAVGNADSGSLKLNLATGPTYYAEAADTFTIAPGSYNLIMFRELKATNEFLVYRRTLSATGTSLTGTVA